MRHIVLPHVVISKILHCLVNNVNCTLFFQMTSKSDLGCFELSRMLLKVVLNYSFTLLDLNTNYVGENGFIYRQANT